MAENVSNNNLGQQPSPKELLFNYLPYLPWVILSVLFFLSLAYLKLRYSTPVYNVTSKILVKDNNPYGKGTDKFSSIMTLPNGNTNLSNEIEVIKSRSLAGRVVRTLGMQQQYSLKGSIRTFQGHYSDIPFQWYVEK